jgi:hypothetical protein
MFIKILNIPNTDNNTYSNSNYSDVFFNDKMLNTKCWKCRPQSDHMERSDLAKIIFIAGWERERAESQEREEERGRG